MPTRDAPDATARTPLSRDATVRRAEAFTRIKALTNNGASTRILVRFDVPNVAALTRTAIAQKQVARGVNADAQLAAAIKTVTDAELVKLAPTVHTVNRRYRSLPFLAMTVSRQALTGLEASPVVLEVAEDRLSAPTLNNTVNITGASASWDLGFDGTGWYVAILDTGIRASHNFFAGKDIVEACFSLGGDCPNGLSSQVGPGSAAHHATQPNSFHGTHVAGIATGNGPDFPAAGVARGANIIAIQVFSQFTNCDGGGDCVRSFTSDQIAAMSFVFSRRLTLNIASVNMSLGGPPVSSQASCDSINSFEKASIDNLRSVGIATVISSGNDGSCSGVSSPGCISSAVAVGATTDSDTEVGFSNFHASMLDIYAPGSSVLASWGTGDASYANLSGTSMAAPHVAGAWAILKQANPNASVDAILTALQETGAAVTGRCVGAPSQRRIQIDDALALIQLPCAVDELLASDAANGDRFATAVAVDGDVIVSGAPFTDDTFNDSGSVYIYRFDGDGWPQEAKLTATDPISGDQFGNSVGVSGDVAVIGAHLVDDAGGNSGAAYVWRYNGANWEEEQKLTASDAAASDFFGTSVAVDGDLAVVGAFIADCPDSSANCGAVYVYRYNGVDWDEEQILVASDASPNDVFGVSVAIDGDLVVVGAQNVACAGGSCGAAYVFRFDGANWVEEEKLVASDQAHLDLYGARVGVHSDVIVVGARGDDCENASTNCGAAYVYRHDGANWNEEAKLVAWDAATEDEFGGAVAVGDGVLLVGAKDKDCGQTTTDCGATYVFRADGGEWNGERSLSQPQGASGDQFGSVVALGGPIAVVGAARRDCSDGSNCGAAHVFGVGGDCNQNGTDDVCDIESGFSDDCDANKIPDECDPDCNENDIPDTCDIDSGFSDDCNANGIADECEPDCNENGIADSCDIASGFSQDTDQDGLPDECCAASSPLPQLIGSDMSVKNRFLSFRAGDPGRTQAIRVTFDSLPPPFDLWDGAVLWAGPTGEVSEAGGSVLPQPGVPNFTVSVLQCTPFFTDWSLLGEVHVTHEGVIPLGEYSVAVVDELCVAGGESGYSLPLVIVNPKSGDTVADLASVPPPPPDGQLAINDVLAVLGAFSGALGAITKSRADLEPGCLDLTINVSDALVAISGFQALPYPFVPSTLDPCNSVCDIPVP